MNTSNSLKLQGVNYLVIEFFLRNNGIIKNLVIFETEVNVP